MEFKKAYEALKQGHKIKREHWRGYWVKENGMPYGEFLQHTLNSDIVVDLLRPGQSGLTVRTLEALFYNKKL